MTVPADVPYGTLDLMVLKTLEAMGHLHGYGIARRIEQAAEGSLTLDQGTIYPRCSACSSESDLERMGCQREQPPSAFLCDHARRPQAAGRRD